MSEAPLSKAVVEQIFTNSMLRDQLKQRAQRLVDAAKAEADRSGRTIMGEKLHLEFSVRPGDKAKYGTERPQWSAVADLTEHDHEVDSRHAKATPRQVLRKAARG